ncbi:MAG TPA: GNAT family protein [Roseiflexaceae bacterium]|nr:GNAT family protein [Roseiflexaceae bacterium]
MKEQAGWFMSGEHTTQATEARYPVVVPGERVYLSLVRRDDAPLFAQWFHDLELTAYLGASGMAFSLEQEQDFVDRVARQQDVRTFAIVVRESQRMIGTVSLMDINDRHGVATLGIAIGDRSAWGQGYGSEAVRLMCRYGFTFLNLYHIRLWHVGFNERGHHAYLKAGFREAGRLHGVVAFNGKRYDEVLMEITRDDIDADLAFMIGQLGSE